MASPGPSERDGLSNSERRSVDLGAFYLNSSVLQTITNLGTVVFCFVIQNLIIQNNSKFTYSCNPESPSFMAKQACRPGCKVL